MMPCLGPLVEGDWVHLNLPTIALTDEHFVPSHGRILAGVPVRCCSSTAALWRKRSRHYAPSRIRSATGGLVQLQQPLVAMTPHSFPTMAAGHLRRRRADSRLILTKKTR